MIFLDWIGKGGDPFWDQVLLLLPFSDSGTTFTDYGPLANTVTLNTGGTTVVSQNSVWTNFGNNTFQNQTSGGWYNSLTVVNTGSPLAATDDLCIEYQFYQRVVSNAVTSPLHLRFDQVNSGGALSGRRLDFYSTAPVTLSTATFRALASGPTFTGPITFDLNAVKTIALQFIAADGLAYVYVDGVNTDSFSVSLVASAGWSLVIGEPTAGPTANVYDMSMSGLRITRANRYGNQPTIPVPSEPWPIGP